VQVSAPDMLLCPHLGQLTWFVGTDLGIAAMLYFVANYCVASDPLREMRGTGSYIKYAFKNQRF